MSREDLVTVLWFVETCVMSNRMYFDGTLPPDEGSAAEEVIDGFVRRHRVARVRVGPIGFKKSAEILGHAASAAEESSLVIHDLVFRDVDRAVKPDEHETFFRFVMEDASLTDQARADRAAEFVDRRFRGSKCLGA